MRTFTNTLDTVTGILGHAPNACVADKPESELDHKIRRIRELADCLIDDASAARVEELLREWLALDDGQDRYRNYCRLGQIVQLVNVGLIDADLLNQINFAWSRIFSLFGQYHYVVHPQYYFVCEIDSYSVSLEVVPGVMTQENIVKLIRKMVGQGKRHEAAGLLMSLVN